MFRFLLALVCLLVSWSKLAAADSRPNFLVIFIDDMGSTDLGCYGSKFYQTPNIDRLAAEGMRFTQAYSACTVCSPSRAALMTGKYPARLHITDWIEGHKRPYAKLSVPEWTMELPTSEKTIATALKERGYATAHIGKWHLTIPATEHGFDVSIADNGRGQPASYLVPYKNPNLSDGPPGEELTARCTEEAEKFIEAHRDQPWFMYLAHFAVHTPLGGKPEVIQKYRRLRQDGAPQNNATYAAMVEAVDDSVGSLRAKLDALKLSEKTVIIFTSDNGGLLPVTKNLDVRAGKGSAYEGGVRVPAIVFWPGVTKPGSVSNAPVITMDWTATIAEAVGAKLPGDGVSLLPLLEGGSIAKRNLAWHYPHYHPGGATPYSALREGDFRLVEFFEDDHLELYDLASDPFEKHDLAESQSAKASELRAKLETWRQEVGAQLPTPNPKFDPEK